MGRRRPKVFCIGFHKTGTSSLEAALDQLGYSVTGMNGVRDPRIGEKIHNLTIKMSRRFDAFQDNPWPMVYKEMDALYPDAKFIMTLRDNEKWIASAVKHFATTSSPMREYIYGKGHGFPAGNEELYCQVKTAHEDAVRAHFANRPGKLLEMDVTKGDGWELLCPFLGLEIPKEPFPHANAGSKRGKELAMVPALLRAIRRARYKIKLNYGI